MKQLFFISSCVLMLFSCKTTKNNSTDIIQESNNTSSVIDGSVKTSKNAEVQNLADAHYSLFSEFNTLEIKADVDYKDKNQAYAPSADIKIDKNKKILIAIKAFGITGAKVYITPESISYYEILNGTHYEGDYQLIQQYLGTKLTYENIENLLLGKALFDINTNHYTKTNNKELELKLNQFLLRLVFGTKNEIASTEVTQAKSADKLSIQYPSYQRTENIYLPKEINIHAMQKEAVQIKVDYKKVSVNQNLDFRFKIPNNSKPIKI